MHHPLDVEWSKAAEKYIRRLGKPNGPRIVEAVLRFAADGAGDVKKLQGVSGHRLRVGGWRVLFVAIGTRMVVTSIDTRGDAYK